MKHVTFNILAKVNKAILPSYKNKDLTKLTKMDKVIIGWRIWVTLNALGN
ncbi:MAG: hypothetical protein KAK04_09150 [Cyclobacteriaceae bacterium]|nr:hypothetical protein [Cyclobacteriaceae bacterium]